MVQPCTNTLQKNETDVERHPCADYIFGDRKFGGNAQAITRRRWLHHTSFLWDFRDDRMALLQHPEKAPEYRAVRYCTASPTRLPCSPAYALQPMTSSLCRSSLPFKRSLV